MTAELGVFFLVMALVLAMLQGSYLWPSGNWRSIIRPCLPIASWLQAMCVTLAFATLVMLRLNSDFSVLNVITHSNLTLPTLYKITGTWGNHEGSMLLWAALLAGFGALLAGSRNNDTELKSFSAALHALLVAGFLLFILATSNPFARQFPPTVDGQSLNPLLQDVALAIHPPLLYLGYVGFSVVFALAVAALIQGRMGRDWAHMAHPWIMTSWSALTLGIGLGSWWAYRELGWGGWWFWDPVENCSLLPWLTGTALLHANIVLKKRGLLRQWVLLLAIITFAMSLLGTFLVRSGVLTSVHSFASDPERGFFILAYIFVVVGGALLLFGLRAGLLEREGTMRAFSREGMIVINNLFLLSACATVLLGTIYPMLAQWQGHTITVGAPYFNSTFLPLMAAPLFFAGLTPFMPWNQASSEKLRRACMPGVLASLAAILLVLAFTKTQLVLALIGFTLAAWLAASSAKWWRIALPVFVAHTGAAIMVAGITGASLWKEEAQALLAPGDVIEVAGYKLILKEISLLETSDYKGQAVHFEINGTILSPEYRQYGLRQTTTSEAAISRRGMGDLYVVVGATEAGKTAVRAYFTPMIQLIWAGFVLMALGGVFTLFAKRRL